MDENAVLGGIHTTSRLSIGGVRGWGKRHDLSEARIVFLGSAGAPNQSGFGLGGGKKSQAFGRRPTGVDTGNMAENFPEQSGP